MAKLSKVAWFAGTTALVLVICASALARAPVAGPEAAKYTAEGKIISPSDYRDWVFLTSGLDMNYADAPPGGDAHFFDNVFVDPTAFAQFRRTGRWPEGTVLVKESRRGLSKGSINKAGQFQSEPVVAIELHVKDTQRFGGWAFFDSSDGKPAKALSKSEECYVCHGQHGAADSTFVQFYPTLAPIARAHGTLNPKL